MLKDVLRTTDDLLVELSQKEASIQRTLGKVPHGISVATVEDDLFSYFLQTMSREKIIERLDLVRSYEESHFYCGLCGWVPVSQYKEHMDRH